MVWPTAQDYNQAIQHPARSLKDTELQLSSPELWPNGLPRAVTGAFASVYRLNHGGMSWAVRCFLRDVAHQDTSYDAISKFLVTHPNPYFVKFTYIAEGIRIGQAWYPILKMDWVDGQPLNVYVEQHLSHPDTIRDLAAKWLHMSEAMTALGASHGDIQHGNVLVTPTSQLVLVDYDGMYVPSLAGSPSPELGHPNFQHPRRAPADFNQHLDRFPCWAVYTALIALTLDPSLWHRFSSDGESMLFRRRDFADPSNAAIWDELTRGRAKPAAPLASMLRSFLFRDLKDIPALTRYSAPSAVSFGPAVSVPTVRPGVPFEAASTSGGASAHPDAGWVLDHLPKPKRASSPTPRAWERIAFATLVIVGLIPALIAFPIGFVAILVGFMLAVSLAFCCFSASGAYRERKAYRQRLRSAEGGLRDASRRTRQFTETALRAEANRDRESRDLASELTTLEGWENQQVTAARTRADRDAAEPLRRIAELDTAEATERRTAMEKLRKHELGQLLARHTLSSASISGISDSLKGGLRSVGVQTAADVEGVRNYSTYRAGYQNQKLHVIVRGRGPEYVYGIGPTKGAALMAWRQGLEKRYASSLPTSLPAAEESIIRQRHELLRNPFRATHDQIRTRLAAEITRLRETTDLRRIQLEARRSTAMLTCDRQLADIHLQLAEAHQATATAQWKVAQHERDLEAFSDVKFRTYLKRYLRAA